MRIKIPEFANKELLFDYLVKNKKELIAEKCRMDIESEVVKAATVFLHSGEDSNKSEAGGNPDEVQVKVVMNTTNYRDGHGDVHLPGLWAKTLQEGKPIHLQEHKATFANVIDPSPNAYTQTKTWKELGFNFSGTTQALIFESTVSKEQNAEMFRAYKNKVVKNHSVGMRYVKLELAVNSDKSEYKAEKAVWDANINFIANRDETEKEGFFWAIKEAKLKEGSAVLFGSNPTTPTLETKTSTEDEPDKSTQQQPQSVFEYLNKIIK